MTYNGSFVADTIIKTLEPEALEAISPLFPRGKGSISSALQEQEVVQNTTRLKEWCLGKTTVREQMCAVFFFDDMNVCEKAESTKKPSHQRGCKRHQESMKIVTDIVDSFKSYHVGFSYLLVNEPDETLHDEVAHLLDQRTIKMISAHK